jgi:hypothetical protein
MEKPGPPPATTAPGTYGTAFTPPQPTKRRYETEVKNRDAGMVWNKSSLHPESATVPSLSREPQSTWSPRSPGSPGQHRVVSLRPPLRPLPVRRVRHQRQTGPAQYAPPEEGPEEVVVEVEAKMEEGQAESASICPPSNAASRWSMLSCSCRHVRCLRRHRPQEFNALNQLGQVTGA